MKVRVAIIEDEYFARQAIKKYIDRLGDPYEVCGEACDGQEGLELLRQAVPDIALVDITMPRINGIDMIQRAEDEGLPTQMIILTGYSDFSYARAAVRLGVREYLLKPLRIEDLAQALAHASKGMNREEKGRIPEGIDVDSLLGRQLAEQLTRVGTDSQDTDLMIEHLGFPRDAGVYYVALMQYHREGEELPALISRLSGAALKGLGDSGFPAICCPDDFQSICFVVNMKSDGEFGKLKEALERLGNEMCQTLDVLLKVSVSRGRASLNMIHDAWLEAHAIQQYYLFFDRSRFSIYTSENLVGEPSALFDAEVRHTLTMLLRKKDEAAIQAFIGGQFLRFQQNNARKDTVYLCAAEMMSAIFEYSSTRFGDIVEGTPSGNAFSELYSLTHIDDVERFIQKLAREVIHRDTSDRNAHSALIRRVHEYIDSNFSNSALRLEDVARANYISSPHLCSVYRRATQSTIGDYIFEARMRHAVELIGEGKRNVADISEACGYDDPGYFSKCFRKRYGMTPREYIEAQST